MTRRWVRRPEGSTWGDWGDDDQLGRLNLLTPEKVRQGVAEVREGISFCLSLPLDVPGGRGVLSRRRPPVLAPTEDFNGEPAAFFNVHHSQWDPRYVDVYSDDDVTLSLQYSTQWDALAHCGAEFDADGDGVDEAVYYNGFRAGEDVVGPAADASGDGREHVSFARRLGIEHMAWTGVQGRGVLVDLAHHLGDEHAFVGHETLQGIMEADGVVVEPGDMLVLHTGWATRLLEMNLDPDPARVHSMCAVLDGHDRRLLDWITESRIAALIADNYAVEGVRRGDDPDESRHAYIPLHHHCLFKVGVHLGELWYLHELAGWLREHGRKRFLLTAPPLRLPGAVASPTTPVATV
jgi:kynurenine formamidase